MGRIDSSMSMSAASLSTDPFGLAVPVVPKCLPFTTAIGPAFSISMVGAEYDATTTNGTSGSPRALEPPTSDAVWECDFCPMQTPSSHFPARKVRSVRPFRLAPSPWVLSSSLVSSNEKALMACRREYEQPRSEMVLAKE